MIVLKRPDELALMREAGRIVAEVLALMGELIRPGVMTKELDQAAEALIRRRGATPSFLGYPPNGRYPFPASICASINEELVHGIPGPRVLREGDIITVDVGTIYKGYQGDAARTYPVGRISEEAQQLLAVTQAALEAGIAQAVIGNRLGDISAAIQRTVESRGYYITRVYTGHGIGRAMHEEPTVFNFGNPGQGIPLRRGLTIALEPMVLIDTGETRELPDHWTVVSANGKLTAHFEHTIAVTDDGPDILTRL